MLPVLGGPMRIIVEHTPLQRWKPLLTFFPRNSRDGPRYSRLKPDTLCCFNATGGVTTTAARYHYLHSRHKGPSTGQKWRANSRLIYSTHRPCNPTI